MAENKHPALAEVARSVREKLKCSDVEAMAHAVDGVASAARAVGLKVATAPSEAEIEAILNRDFARIERALLDSAKALSSKPTPPKGKRTK